MTDFILGVLYAVAGTIGFSILFRIDLKRLPMAALGGGLSWAMYLIVFSLSDDILTSTLCAAFFSTIYSESLAVICRTPATTFLLPCLIPLVPGGGLYYTMSYLLAKDYEMMGYYGRSTAASVLGIAGGVMAGSLIVYGVRSLRRRAK